MDSVETWLVKFSPPKTESLIISNKAHLAEHPPIHMNGSVFNEVSHHKHVGIMLSKDLSWHKHISQSINQSSLFTTNTGISSYLHKKWH